VKGTYLFRTWTHFVDDFIDLTNGVTAVTRDGRDYGTFTNVVYKNTDVPMRDYHGVVVQSGYRPNSRLTFSGHYTVELKNDGQFEGEGTNTPASASIYGNFPEIYEPALDRLFPNGHLADYQRHKVRVYGTYSQPLGRFGSVDISPLWRVNSAQTYSLFASSVPLSTVQLSRNPGYPRNDISPSTRQTLYFGDRGQYFFKGYGLVDLSATYSIPTWKSARPWIKVEFYNLLNNQKLIKWNTQVTPDPTSPKDANGLPTGYIPGGNFGKATLDSHFAQPIPGINGGRLFRLAFGVRF
jgi:hypothetical protein